MNEILIIESMKKKEIIDINDMMKYDEDLGNFNDDYKNKKFFDKVKLKMNDNDDDYE